MICHTIKTEIAYGKFWKRRTIISSFSFYKNLVALVFRRFSFPAFQLYLNFQNFPAYGSAFPAATAAAFPAFWRRSSHTAASAAAQVGMALLRNYARLVKFGRNGKIWKVVKFWMNC